MAGGLVPFDRDDDKIRLRRPDEFAELTSPVLRGMKLDQPQGLMELAEYIARTDPLHINLLSKCIPHKFGYEHLLVVGASGAGKTTCINQVLQDCLWHVGQGYGHRVFLWDYKRTARRFLAALPLKVPVYILDPVDRRSHGIDWPRELNTNFAAKQFAKQVVFAEADRGGQNFVFTANARAILYHVIRTFIKFAPGKWDLTDVIEACSSPGNLFRVLSKTPKGAAKKETVFGAKGQAAGVFFSLEEFASDFGPIAAALSKIEPERRITLQDWFDGEGVLVLSHYEEYEEGLSPFQRWVFGAVQRKLLSRSDIPHDGRERTTFFLDEVRNAPFVGRDLMKLMNSGRSKGGMVVTGLGGISGLMDAIGEKKAEEYLGMCKTKVFLRLDGSAAEWVSEKFFGKQLRMVRKYSEGESVAESFGVNENWQAGKWQGGKWEASSGPNHGTSKSHTRTPSRNFSYEPTERPVLYAGELKGLPSPRIEGANGLVVRGYMVVEGNAWKECATHMDQTSFVIDEDFRDIEKRPDEDFDNDEMTWGDEDLIRLGLVEGQLGAKSAEGPPSLFETMMSGAGWAAAEEPPGDEDEDEDDPNNSLLWYEDGELEELRGEGS